MKHKPSGFKFMNCKDRSNFW